MTCLEKYLKDHPEEAEHSDEVIHGFCPNCDTPGIDIPDPDYCDGGDSSACVECWNRQVPGTEPTAPTIKDSGTRQQFPTGARDTGPKWISVKERRPDSNGRYLCNVKSFAFPGKYYVTILKCDRGEFMEEKIYTDDVTHWMELPECPEEDKNA